MSRDRTAAVKDQFGMPTPLHRTMSREHAAAKDQFGMTPLHRAAVFGHVDTILLLLDMGAMINDQNDVGYSPLHYATSNGHAETARLLLQKGADYSLQNIKGHMPLDDNFAKAGCTAMDLLVSTIRENEALKVQLLQSAQELLNQKAAMEEEHKALSQMNEELKKHEEQLNVDLDDNINAWQTEIDGLTEKIAVLEKEKEKLRAKNKQQRAEMEAAKAHKNRGINRMVVKPDKGTRRLAGLRPSDVKGLRKFVTHGINLNESSSTVKSRAEKSDVSMGEEEGKEEQQLNPQTVQSYTEGSKEDELSQRRRVSSSTTSWGRGLWSRSSASKSKGEEVNPVVVFAVEPFESTTCFSNKPDSAVSRSFDITSSSLSSDSKKKDEDGVAVTGQFEPTSALTFHKTKDKPRPESLTAPSLTRSRSSPLDATSSNKTYGKPSPETGRLSSVSHSLLSMNTKKPEDVIVPHEPFESFNIADQQPNPLSFVPGKVDYMRSFWLAATQKNNGDGDEPSSALFLNKPRSRSQTPLSMWPPPAINTGEEDVLVVVEQFEATRSLSFNKTNEKTSAEKADKMESSVIDTFGTSLEDHELLASSSDKKQQAVSPRVTSQRVLSMDADASLISPTIVTTSLNCIVSSFSMKQQDEAGSKSSLDEESMSADAPLPRFTTDSPVSLTTNEQNMENQKHESSQKLTMVGDSKKIDNHGHNKVLTATNTVLSPATFSQELQQQEQPRLARLLELQQNPQDHQLPSPTEDRFSSNKFSKSLFTHIQRKRQEQQQQQHQIPREGQELKQQYPQQPSASAEKNGLEQLVDLSSLAAQYNVDIEGLSKGLFSMRLGKSNFVFQNPLSLNLPAHDQWSTEALSMFTQTLGDQPKDASTTTQCEARNVIDQPSSHQSPAILDSLVRSPTWFSSLRLPTEPLSMFMSTKKEHDERPKDESEECIAEAPIEPHVAEADQQNKLESPVLPPTSYVMPVDWSTPESMPMVMMSDKLTALLDDDTNQGDVVDSPVLSPSIGPVSRAEKMEQEEEEEEDKEQEDEEKEQEEEEKEQEEEGQEIIFFGNPMGDEPAWNVELCSSSRVKTPHQEQGHQIEETVIMDNRDESDQSDSQEIKFFGNPTGDEAAWNVELCSSSRVKTPHQEQGPQIEETVIMDNRDESDQSDKGDATEDAARGIFAASSASSSHLKKEATDKMTESRDSPLDFGKEEEEEMIQTSRDASIIVIVDDGVDEANKNGGGGLHFGTQQLADEFHKHQHGKKNNNKLKRAIRSFRGTFRKQKHGVVSGQE